MSLEQAAKSVGMPEATPNDVRTPEGRAQFEQGLDPVSERAELHNQQATGRRKMNMRGRVAVGAALSASLLVTPQGREAASTVVEPVVEAAQAFNDNLDKDRVFNPDAGNPENTEEIVESWSQDPSKTVVTVDAQYSGSPEVVSPDAEQAGLPAEITPNAVTIEREAEG